MRRFVAKKAVGELRHLDCSHIKLHQHGANPRGGQAREAIGHTKGGLNTKLAAVVDGRGRAVALDLATGPRHDLKAIAPLLPALRGKRAVGDKGFDADTFRATLHRHGARICISPRRRRRRRFRFHRGYYRHRHHVENFFCRIKRFRRVSTRYHKRSLCFLPFILFAAVLDWLTLVGLNTRPKPTSCKRTGRIEAISRHLSAGASARNTIRVLFALRAHPPLAAPGCAIFAW